MLYSVWKIVWNRKKSVWQFQEKRSDGAFLGAAAVSCENCENGRGKWPKMVKSPTNLFLSTSLYAISEDKFQPRAPQNYKVGNNSQDGKEDKKNVLLRFSWPHKVTRKTEDRISSQFPIVLDRFPVRNLQESGKLLIFCCWWWRTEEWTARVCVRGVEHQEPCGICVMVFVWVRCCCCCC